MKTKSEKIIEVLVRIGYVLSKIVYIFCIVGMIGCIVGAVALCVGENTLKLGGVTLHTLLTTTAGMGLGTVWAAITAGLILCAGEIVVARRACSYFANVRQVGTPFTRETATQLQQLGISAIWISVVSVVLARVAEEIIGQLLERVEPLELSTPDSVAIGIGMLIVSVLCHRAAELTTQEKEE